MRYKYRRSDEPNIKLVELFKLVVAGLWLGHSGLFWWFSFASLRYSMVLFHTLGVSGCHNTWFWSSPHR